jgi:hypothetical protein
MACVRLADWQGAGGLGRALAGAHGSCPSLARLRGLEGFLVRLAGCLGVGWGE